MRIWTVLAPTTELMQNVSRQLSAMGYSMPLYVGKDYMPEIGLRPTVLKIHL
tara:strand:- start:1807 stop:1962 length:156 start_codon:yes stop_codon:yes gene_type:complete